MLHFDAFVGLLLFDSAQRRGRSCKFTTFVPRGTKWKLCHVAQKWTLSFEAPDFVVFCRVAGSSRERPDRMK
jgi:hypothetical protein